MSYSDTQSLTNYPDTIVTGRSPVQVAFRIAVLFLVILVIWVGILLNTYWSTQNEIITTLADEEKEMELLATQGLIVSVVGWIGGLLLAAVVILGAWLCIRISFIRLTIDRRSISPPEGNAVLFENIAAIVFVTDTSEPNRMLHEGVLSPADSKPDTSLDSIYLLPPGIDAKEFVRERHEFPRQATAIRNFYQHPRNEKIALEIARRFIEKNESGTVWTVVDKFKKQRVVWRKPSPSK